MSYEVRFADVSPAKINNIEGDSLAQEPEAIPPFWTPRHVARRLIEAFQMDARMPRVKTPKRPGGSHPAIVYTREELAEHEQEPQRFPLSLREIAVMETVLDWLLIVRVADEAAYFSLRAWLLFERNKRAGGKNCRSVVQLCERIGVKRVTFIDRKDKALWLICSRLCELSTPVF